MSGSMRDWIKKGFENVEGERAAEQTRIDTLDRNAAGFDQFVRNTIEPIFEDWIITARDAIQVEFELDHEVDSANRYLRLAVGTDALPAIPPGWDPKKHASAFVVELGRHGTTYLIRQHICGMTASGASTEHGLPAQAGIVQTSFESWVTNFAAAVKRSQRT